MYALAEKLKEISDTIQRTGEKMRKNIFGELKKYCPRGYVTRDELKKLTGGLLCRRTMALLAQSDRRVNSQKVIRRKTVYFIDDFINWLNTAAELINFDD